MLKRVGVSIEGTGVLKGTSVTRFFAEIFASKGAPPVSTTPEANFATRTTGVVDSGSKLPPLSMGPVANNGNNIILLTNLSELKEKNYLYVNSTKQGCPKK